MSDKLDIFSPDRSASVADSLLSVDWPASLSDIELAFCRHHVSGKHPTRAFMSAQSDAGELINKASAARCAGLLLRRIEVVKYIKDLREAMMQNCVAKGGEIMAYLSSAIFTPIAEIDDTSPLCTKKVVVSRTDKEGVTTTTTTYESVSKMESIKQLSRMQGLDAPIKVDHTHSGNVMLMPFSTNEDEWSKAVMAEQKKLQDDAINI
ncbi:hypothetical protein OAB00_01395 [Akkermansiaceae bacterium]|nr:hypothetical protein [Akkermansiaceae bacterium]